MVLYQNQYSVNISHNTTMCIATMAVLRNYIQVNVRTKVGHEWVHIKMYPHTYICNSIIKYHSCER